MSYRPKPKKAATRDAVANVAAGWAFFPAVDRKQIVDSVTSAIGAHHELARPQRVDETALKEANLALPKRPQCGRPSSVVDILVSRLAHIYAKHRRELGTRSWNGAQQTEFERVVEGVFQIAGIEKGAGAAIKRHIEARKLLPDI